LVYIQYSILPPFLRKRINYVYMYVPLLIPNVTVFLDIAFFYDLVFESV
jgi:hypothetical protein